MKLKKPQILPWIKQVPPSPSHGSTTLQKRFWKLTSDFVRIRDFEKYGTCIACGKRFDSWQESQAGHYKSWASCRGFSKWDVKNIFGECAYCNTGFNGNEVGANFKEGIIKRYGEERMVFINELAKHPVEKLDEWRIVEQMEALRLEFNTLKEKPTYLGIR